MAYTNPEFVAEELQTTTFSSSTTPTEDTVARYIKQAGEIIDRRLGTIQSTEFDEYYDGNGSRELVLDNKPLVSVSSVLVETNGLGGASEGWLSYTERRTTGNYSFIKYPDEGKLYFWNGSPAKGYRNIRVVYNAGYSTIPDVVKELAAKLVAYRILKSGEMGNIHSSQDDITIGPIRVAQKSTVGKMMSLKSEIEELWEMAGDFKIRGTI